MNLVVNVDLDWGIGRDGDLLVNLADDMRHFRQLTIGKTIILGRKTLATFPRGLPLPERTNLVLTKDRTFKLPGAVVCHSLAGLAAYVAGHPAEEMVVVGGDSVYRQLLPFCRQAFVTKVWHNFAADRFFPDLDQEPGWRLVKEEPRQKGLARGDDKLGEVEFSFCLYHQDRPQLLQDNILVEG